MFNILVKLQQAEGFHMDLDDYLIGLLQMASELVSIWLIFILATKKRRLSM